jgi:hypothetical protein
MMASMKLFALLTACWGFLALSSDTLDVKFLTTQRSMGNPFALPVRVNSKGDVFLFGGNGEDNLIFRPTMQVGFSRAIINYSRPVILNRFNFYPQQSELGWIEVKRFRFEGGLGLSAIIKASSTIGFMPYKGAMNTIIRNKNSGDDKSLPFSMPEKLSHLEEWNTNDIGTFQTYGGITVYAGFSAGMVDLATISVGLQNQFIVEMQKLSPEIVKLSITEEDLKRRQAVLGPVGLKATYAQFKGQRFSAEFLLDLTNYEHHALFHEALKGNIHILQKGLDGKLQKLSWRGKDGQYYYGIPAIIGKVKDSGHYDLDEEGVETKLDFTGSRTKGILTPMRNLQDFVYQTEEGMVVVWSSEMNRTNKRAFEKRFLSIGRTIGVKGFNREVPDDTKFGSVVSQVAVQISKKEVESINDMNMEEVAIHLKDKCEAEKLPCRNESRLRSIISKLIKLRLKPWKEMRGDLGLLLIKEPAIIHAVVKTKKYKKEVYFKFLSEKYQSLEGSSIIEL